MKRGRVLIAVAAAALLAGGTIPAPTAPAAPLRFTAPVRVSPELSEAWEPVLLVDRFDNIFMHARKATTNLVVAPDPGSPTQTRSMSWVWRSSDGGRTFGPMPGLPLNAENHDWGYEGDFAMDDAGHLYFVDQMYADSNITRWTVTGRGAATMDFHRPFIPTAQPIEDRPWLAAHGDGVLFYAVNAGDSLLNPTGRDGGDAYGPGRYSVYRSTDAANTFEPVGHSLRDSGGCRPAADHRPGSRLVYLACTNDAGKVLAFVSEDDGATYARHTIGSYNANADTFDWPLVTVGENGDVWVLHIDADQVEQTGDGFQILTNRLNLYRSADKGRTWSRQDITPNAGRYRWGWIVASPSGNLALAIQHRPSKTSPWHAYAAIFSPGSVPVLSPVDTTPVDDASRPEPPSEMTAVAFTGEGTLAVAWTRIESVQGQRFRRVYFARSIAPSSA
ncbi:MAG: sialidase family protein, partial [Actinomycetota bacterium]